MSNFQTYLEELEYHNLNITGRKQAKIKSETVERIERRDTHI